MTRNFDAAREGAPLLNCFECEREIPGGAWFARIRLGNQRVAFCRPRCVEAFLDHPEAAAPDSRSRRDISAGGVTHTKNAKELPRDGEQVSNRKLELLCD